MNQILDNAESRADLFIATLEEDVGRIFDTVTRQCIRDSYRIGFIDGQEWEHGRKQPSRDGTM